MMHEQRIFLVIIVIMFVSMFGFVIHRLYKRPITETDIAEMIMKIFSTGKYTKPSSKHTSQDNVGVQPYMEIAEPRIAPQVYS